MNETDQPPDLVYDYGVLGPRISVKILELHHFGDLGPARRLDA